MALLVMPVLHVPLLLVFTQSCYLQYVEIDYCVIPGELLSACSEFVSVVTAPCVYTTTSVCLSISEIPCQHSHTHSLTNLTSSSALLTLTSSSSARFLTPTKWSPTPTLLTLYLCVHIWSLQC